MDLLASFLYGESRQGDIRLLTKHLQTGEAGGDACAVATSFLTLKTLATMKRTASEELSRPSSVKIARSLIKNVSGDSHTYYGNVYNEVSSHAGNQLRSYHSKDSHHE